MVQVGGTKNSAPLPGNREHGSLVFRVHQGHCVLKGQRFITEHQVGSSQGTHPALPTKLPTQFICPGSSCIDDSLGF